MAVARNNVGENVKRKVGNLNIIARVEKFLKTGKYQLDKRGGDPEWSWLTKLENSKNNSLAFERINQSIYLL